MTMEQAVSQTQRELLTIRAQIASRVHEDAPSPIDVNHQVVRRNSLAKKRISNSGQGRRRHSSLKLSRSPR